MRVTAAGELTVLVVDDHPVVRDGVGLLVRQAPGVSLLGGAETGRAALEQAERDQPDVVLLDLRLPDMSAADVIRRLRVVAPRARVVIFTAYGDHAAVHAALEAGAHGVLLKDVGTTDLVRAIRAVAAGERIVDPRLSGSSEHLADALARAGITPREHEVLRLVAGGRTNPEIAEALGLARNTVKTYLQSAMQKLGARNRIEAVSRASELRLL